jgi:hypothetical protein
VPEGGGHYWRPSYLRWRLSQLGIPSLTRSEAAPGKSTRRRQETAPGPPRPYGG